MFIEGPDRGNPGSTVNTPFPRRKRVIELAESRLRGNPYLALKSVSCDYQDGALILHGCLPSYYLKQHAQEAVSGLAGVDQIVNEIEVVGHDGR